MSPGNDIHTKICTPGIQLIEELADAIDKLTSAVAEKAIEVSKNPGGGRMREDLNSLRQGWAEKVQSLKKVIDEIIDPEDFITLSGKLASLR